MNISSGRGVLFEPPGSSGCSTGSGANDGALLGGFEHAVVLNPRVDGEVAAENVGRIILAQVEPVSVVCVHARACVPIYLSVYLSAYR